MRAFTLIELIFVIVLIGVLSAVAVPKFAGMRDNAKITSELSTAASVQTALESCHGEWILNDADFVCGAGIDPDSEDFNATSGYPVTLGSSDKTPLDLILKNGASLPWVRDSEGHYRGPASNGGVTRQIRGKPDADDYWVYDGATGSFFLVEKGE